MEIVSACLLGINCNYKGSSNENEIMMMTFRSERYLPVCPELLGGLGIPRPAAEIQGDRVITIDGRDVTSQFERGAEEVVKICRLFGIEEAILRQGSPSCGCGEIKDGSFSGKVIQGDGITTRFLKRNGIYVYPDNSICF